MFLRSLINYLRHRSDIPAWVVGKSSSEMGLCGKVAYRKDEKSVTHESVRRFESVVVVVAEFLRTGSYSQALTSHEPVPAVRIH